MPSIAAVPAFECWQQRIAVRANHPQILQAVVISVPVDMVER
jgi:hypothetical protein